MAAKATLASFVMVLAIWLLGTFHIVNIFVVLPIAMLVYFATATLLRTIPGEDIRALYSALRQKVHVSTQSLVNQQELSSMDIADQPTEILPSLFAGVQSIHGGIQEIQSSFSAIDTPLSSTSLSEIELAPEDMLDLSDAYAQTDPQLEVPWWLRPAAVSYNMEPNGLVQRWQERWGQPFATEQSPQKDDNND